MIGWYINKMIEAHKEKRWDDRRNYATMANVDFVQYFYLDDRRKGECQTRN